MKHTYSENYKQHKATEHKKAYWTRDNMKKAGAAYIEAIRTIRDAIKADGINAALRVSVSPGNVKTGAIPSVSLLPGVTCPAACKETCGVACYAWKIALLRSNVMRSCARNTALATLLPSVYWKQVKDAAYMSRWFRFHVAGDIPNARYFERMIETVKECPGTTFLCFTKRYSVVNDWIARNGELPSNCFRVGSDSSRIIRTTFPKRRCMERKDRRKSGYCAVETAQNVAAAVPAVGKRKRAKRLRSRSIDEIIKEGRNQTNEKQYIAR